MLDGSVEVLGHKHPSGDRLPGEVVRIKCDDDFVFYDSDAEYVYECLENGTWNNTKEAICMKG